MKSIFANPIALAAFGLCGLNSPGYTAATDVPASEQSREWSFDVVPYLWVAGCEGTFGLPNSPAATSRTTTETTDSFITHLSAAAMLSGQVHYREVGLLLDGAWVQLKSEGSSESSAYSGTEIKTDIAYGTMALTYRLRPLAKLETDLIAGTRVWHIANELDYEAAGSAPFTANSSRTWWDPIVGASVRYDLTKSWFGTVLGDVGGFGVGSDISWNVFGGVGYRFTSWFSATLGYRYLHIDYDKQGFLMKANVQGLLLGLGFHF